MKDFPEFIFTRRQNASMWLKRDLASPAMIEIMADADRLFDQSDCVVIKDQKKIKVGRVSLRWEGKTLDVYIKRYNAFSFRYRLQSFFACSGAEKSLDGVATLAAIGVRTARPIAAVEYRRRGMLVKSFFVSEEIAQGKTADAFWRRNLMQIEGPIGFHRRRAFLKKLSGLFARLHAHNVYHNDLKDANIVVAPEMESLNDPFFLLDLEGVRRLPRLSRSRQIKNLVQLNRTFGKYLRRTERLYFLKCYQPGNTADRRTRKAWADDLHRHSGRLDRIKSLAHGL